MSCNFASIPKVPEPIKAALKSLCDRYDILSQNSEGGNGYVFVAENRLLQTRAVVKFYNWEGEQRYHLEPQALTAFDSPNVLKVLDAGITDESWAYFVTPFCSEGSLDKLLGARPVGVIEAFDICSNVLNGLTYLHSARFIHRDLKPGNIYLHGGKAVIGDFGSLVLLPHGQSEVTASRHAVLYRPPESITLNHYGMSGDIYQVGVVLYQLLGGYLPYDEDNWLAKRELAECRNKSYPANTIFADDCLKSRILRGKLLDYATLKPWAPSPLERLVRRACRDDPKKRFATAADFLAAIAKTRSSLHDWAMVDGVLTLRARPTSYRVLNTEPPFRAQKRRDTADWRNDNTCKGETDLRSLIREIESRC